MKQKKDQFVVVSGKDERAFYGPFKTANDAVEWACDQLSGVWSVQLLRVPQWVEWNR